jgi:hypothetical protein
MEVEVGLGTTWNDVWMDSGLPAVEARKKIDDRFAELNTQLEESQRPSTHEAKNPMSDSEGYGDGDEDDVEDGEIVEDDVEDEDDEDDEEDEEDEEIALDWLEEFDANVRNGTITGTWMDGVVDLTSAQTRWKALAKRIESLAKTNKWDQIDPDNSTEVREVILSVALGVAAFRSFYLNAASQSWDEETKVLGVIFEPSGESMVVINEKTMLEFMDKNITAMGKDRVDTTLREQQTPVLTPDVWKSSRARIIAWAKWKPKRPDRQGLILKAVWQGDVTTYLAQVQAAKKTPNFKSRIANCILKLHIQPFARFYMERGVGLEALWHDTFREEVGEELYTTDETHSRVVTWSLLSSTSSS